MHVTPSKFNNLSAVMRGLLPVIDESDEAAAAAGEGANESSPSFLELILSARLVCRPGTSTRRTSVRSRTTFLSLLIAHCSIYCTILSGVARSAVPRPTRNWDRDPDLVLVWVNPCKHSLHQKPPRGMSHPLHFQRFKPCQSR